MMSSRLETVFRIFSPFFNRLCFGDWTLAPFSNPNPYLETKEINPENVLVVNVSFPTLQGWRQVGEVEGGHGEFLKFRRGALLDTIKNAVPEGNGLPVFYF